MGYGKIDDLNLLDTQKVQPRWKTRKNNLEKYQSSSPAPSHIRISISQHFSGQTIMPQQQTIINSGPTGANLRSFVLTDISKRFDEEFEAVTQKLITRNFCPNSRNYEGPKHPNHRILPRPLATTYPQSYMPTTPTLGVPAHGYPSHSQSISGKLLQSVPLRTGK